MIPSHPVLVSLSSFGAAEVRRHGQHYFARLCHEAGADGVEIRGELLRDDGAELAELAVLLRDTGMDRVYSHADTLWTPEGVLDVAALQQALERALTLEARVVKMSVGGFGDHARLSLHDVVRHAGDAGITLLIENDQTAMGGSVAALQRFFVAADESGLDFGMTFDMGNWHWVGECPLDAAHHFAPRVRYVHCKGVQRQPGKWVAVPLQDSAAPWRAVLRAMPEMLPHAIEYPLVGEDLPAVVSSAVTGLRQLGV